MVRVEEGSSLARRGLQKREEGGGRRDNGGGREKGGEWGEG